MFVRGNEVIERHPSFDLFFCVAELLQSRAVDKREISHHIRFKYHLGQRLSELTDTASALTHFLLCPLSLGHIKYDTTLPDDSTVTPDRRAKG